MEVPLNQQYRCLEEKHAAARFYSTRISNNVPLAASDIAQSPRLTTRRKAQGIAAINQQAVVAG